MYSLNYHHLYYFWTVAKAGSVAAASKQLRLAQPTVSAQIHRLEEQLGSKLFERQGRGLVLTDFGRVAQTYAEEIFALGREFVDTSKGRPGGRPTRLVVGVSDALPKSIVHRILAPTFQLDDDIRVIAREDRPAQTFVEELAMHTVDVVLADSPAASGTVVRAFNHLLGECGTVFFASPEIAKTHKQGFPQSLERTPFILPGANSTLRRSLELWFESLDIRPKIVAEVEDPALGKVLAEEGLGVIAVPDVVEKEVLRRYKVKLLGHAKTMLQRFYAISLERKVKHPAVVAICENARDDIFA